MHAIEKSSVENTLKRGLNKLFSSHGKYHMIIRDYLMAFWLSPEVSTRDPIISPRALARGLIMVEG